MKKLFALSIVLSVILSACTAAPAVPTAVPTIVPSEEPIVIPTEEPTEVPTEVPTEEPTPTPIAIPESCEYAADVSVPQRITMDLGIYGEYELSDAVDFDFFLMHPIFLNPIRQAEADVSALFKEGGEFSFIMPSAGIISTETATIFVAGEDWSDAGIALSPSGEFVIPAGSEVLVKTDGNLSEQEALIEVFFLSGKSILLEDLSYPDSATLSCENGLWRINYKNTSTQVQEFVLSTGYFVLVTDPEESILGVKFPYSENFEVFPAPIFSNLEINLQIKQDGAIDAWVIDLFSQE